MLPGETLTYRYCGREYEATLRGHYRVRVLRSGAWAGAWQLLGAVTFTTGTGRQHRKEAVFAQLSFRDETITAEGLALLERLGREGHRVKFPRTDRDSWLSAWRAWRKGNRSMPSPSKSKPYVCECSKGEHCDEPNCERCGRCAESGVGWTANDAGHDGPLICDTCCKTKTNQTTEGN